MVVESVHGPIDFLLIEFPGSTFPDDVAKEMHSLLEKDTVRLYDIGFLAKDGEGSVRRLDASSASPEQFGEFGTFAGARSGVLNDDDLDDLGAAMSPGCVAVVVVFENSWAIPFVRSALRVGGDVVASARIPAQDVIAALDALESIP